MPRIKIGIVLVGKRLDDLRPYHPAQRRAISALKLLVLAMNSNQSYFEYSFWRIDSKAKIQLLAELQKRGTLPRRKIREQAGDDAAKIDRYIRGKFNDFKIKEREVPEYYIVISLAHFSENWFNIRSEQEPISVVGLGSWKKVMAPPSLHEIILTCVVRESIASACPALADSIHFGTKGCICDFSEPIPDIRLKIFSGFVCDYCQEAISDFLAQKAFEPGFDAEKSHLVDDLTRILDKKWIGDLDEPSSLASTLNKLGVNLFRTKALTPSWGELLLASIRDDGRREFIKMVFTVLVTGLLLSLGWRAIPHPPAGRDQASRPTPTIDW